MAGKRGGRRSIPSPRRAIVRPRAMLHITNGDSAAEAIRRTGVPGTVVAWRDVLHEGPTPAGLMLEGMSDVRARFLASCHWDTFPEISASMGARDAALRSARHVVLWFEHDLYDQLQLLQILATLAMQPETTADLIAIDAFPGIEPFHGLGQLTSPQLATLWPRRRPVGTAQLTLGTKGWKAICSPDPTAVVRFLDLDLSALPLLRAALERHVEEFPAAPNGLSRTERQILHAVAAGHRRFENVFHANQQQETAPFMGDAPFRLRLDALINARVPLVSPEPFALTAAGRRVLAGEADARQLNGIDRWIGGVHLVG